MNNIFYEDFCNKDFRNNNIPHKDFHDNNILHKLSLSWKEFESHEEQILPESEQP